VRLRSPVAPGVAIPRIYRSALGYGIGCGEIPSPQLGCHLFPKTQLLHRRQTTRLHLKQTQRMIDHCDAPGALRYNTRNQESTECYSAAAVMPALAHLRVVDRERIQRWILDCDLRIAGLAPSAESVPSCDIS